MLNRKNIPAKCCKLAGLFVPLPILDYAESKGKTIKIIRI